MSVAAKVPSIHGPEHLVAGSGPVWKPQDSHATTAYPSPPNSPLPTEAHRQKHPGGFGDGSDSPQIVPLVLLTPETGSAGSSDLLHGVPRPTKAQDQMTALILKSRLGLDDWRCGARRAIGIPCRTPIRESTNQDRITAQIESMVHLTRSAATFDTEIKKLVKLVHCRFHNYDELNSARIVVWETMWAGGSDVVSVEKQIRKLLGPTSTQCQATKKDETRCKNKIGGQRVQNCARTIDEIIELDIYLHDEDLQGLLEVLATNRSCHIHQTRNWDVAVWKSGIIGICTSTVLNTQDNAEARHSKATKQDNERSLVNERSRSLDTVSPESKLSRSIYPRFDDPDTYWPKAYDITPFIILNRGTKLSDCTSSYKSVQKEIRRKLDWNEKDSGYVYVYEVEGNEGFVKIGYTSREPKIRHGEWEFDCNRLPKVIYPVATVPATKVPNARRIEALCHAELDYRKITIHCTGCLKQHIEWFEVSPADAIRVVQKWSKWMATGPYQSGVLKQEENRRAGDMDKFMVAIAAATIATRSRHTNYGMT